MAAGMSPPASRTSPGKAAATADSFSGSQTAVSTFDSACLAITLWRMP